MQPSIPGSPMSPAMINLVHGLGSQAQDPTEVARQTLVRVLAGGGVRVCGGGPGMWLAGWLSVCQSVSLSVCRWRWTGGASGWLAVLHVWLSGCSARLAGWLFCLAAWLVGWLFCLAGWLFCLAVLLSVFVCVCVSMYLCVEEVAGATLVSLSTCIPTSPTCPLALHAH